MRYLRRVRAGESKEGRKHRQALATKLDQRDLRRLVVEFRGGVAGNPAMSPGNQREGFERSIISVFLNVLATINAGRDSAPNWYSENDSGCVIGCQRQTVPVPEPFGKQPPPPSPQSVSAKKNTREQEHCFSQIQLVSNHILGVS